jgi:hypothetical protein
MLQPFTKFHVEKSTARSCVSQTQVRALINCNQPDIMLWPKIYPEDLARSQVIHSSFSIKLPFLYDTTVFHRDPEVKQ